ASCVEPSPSSGEDGSAPAAEPGPVRRLEAELLRHQQPFLRPPPHQEQREQEQRRTTDQRAGSIPEGRPGSRAAAVTGIEGTLGTSEVTAAVVAASATKPRGGPRRGATSAAAVAVAAATAASGRPVAEAAAAEGGPSVLPLRLDGSEEGSTCSVRLVAAPSRPTTPAVALELGSAAIVGNGSGNGSGNGNGNGNGNGSGNGGDEGGGSQVELLLQFEPVASLAAAADADLPSGPARHHGRNTPPRTAAAAVAAAVDRFAFSNPSLDRFALSLQEAAAGTPAANADVVVVGTAKVGGEGETRAVQTLASSVREDTVAEGSRQVGQGEGGTAAAGEGMAMNDDDHDDDHEEEEEEEEEYGPDTCVPATLHSPGDDEELPDPAEPQLTFRQRHVHPKAGDHHPGQQQQQNQQRQEQQGRQGIGTASSPPPLPSASQHTVSHSAGGGSATGQGSGACISSLACYAAPAVGSGSTAAALMAPPPHTQTQTQTDPE
ncbi:hypothetical protein Vafri_11703, partial [Volvox africanus]